MNDDRSTREALGRTIQALRSRLGLKRRELAEAADVSYAYLSEIENGKKAPSTKVIAALAAALEMPAHDLLRLADELEVEVRGEERGFPVPPPMAASARISPSPTADRPPPRRWFHSTPSEPMLGDPEGPDPELLAELIRTARLLEHRDLQALVALARRLADG